MIEHGANANAFSQSVKHTPLHWLAYWGDWRAIHALLRLNRRDNIAPTRGGKAKNSSIENTMKENGAFNLFLTKCG